ncbi:reverse transcriptase domain-containing protein [Caerostris darwini]|uniref:Reverse transcriptase domain-containing protein n=1 Tax=Caerostris darwini TaxID=1538125 RepID=A0AAV4RRQ4_9ARAC|nr:reverse transcriptase domain-containing protein [Caerostris darwini]
MPGNVLSVEIFLYIGVVFIVLLCYSALCLLSRALDNSEACTTSHQSPVGALGNAENLHDVSFSPICHRTRSQLANREPTNTVPSLVNADTDNECQIAENQLLEQEVVDTLDDIINHIPLRALSGALIFDASSPAGGPRRFFQDENIVHPVQLCTAPNGLLFDGSSPPARSRTFFQDTDRNLLFDDSSPPVMSGTFFQDADCGSASTHPRSQCVIPIPHAEETACLVPLDHNRDTTVDLFPSAFENSHRLISIKEGKFHKFLCKPVGFNAVPNYSSLNYLAELGGTGGKIDKVIRKEVKNTLNLPTEASNDYVYGQRKLGCCGLPIAAEDSDLNLVDTAFKLLSSRDEICAKNALASPKCTLHRRLGKMPDDQILSDFLSGDFSTTTNKFSNTWTVARVASRRLGTDSTDLTYHRSPSEENQGKAIEVSSLAPASSHFLTDGAYTRFADWRFIHRARLNLVPLNGAKPWLKEIVNTVRELIDAASCLSPSPLSPTCVSESVPSPSTIIEMGEVFCPSPSTIVVVENEPSTIVTIEDVQCDAVTVSPPTCAFQFCDLDSPVLPSASFQFYQLWG